MKNTTLTITIIAAILCAIGLYYAAGGQPPCLRLNGIDHNGNEDPFTISIGAC